MRSASRPRPARSWTAWRARTHALTVPPVDHHLRAAAGPEPGRDRRRRTPPSAPATLGRVDAPVVGFDLDMTLLDTRAGIAATFRALTAQTGVWVDADLAVSRLGPPLQTELAHWFPPDQVAAAVCRFRELYPTCAIAEAVPLPGAHAAVRAVVDLPGEVIVVTAKLGRLAQAHLAHAGIAVSGVIGDRFAGGKVAALTESGAGVYVGDHVADVRAARAAGAVAVGVTTGAHTAAELRAAGADVVLADLRAFPDWLAQRDDRWLRRSRFGIA